MTTESILINTLAVASGGLIGCITLNKPKSLNALDLEMVDIIGRQLFKWHNNNEIKAVLIDSTGEKAFCAGGDIISIYQAMLAQKEISANSLPEFIAQFFTQEYRLDYQIHAYSKPIVCWGDGIIMGGGLGVFAGASTKIVTEHSRVAMPEVSIGLFPDVGASYFLNKMPAGVGKFLGLTGASINATDCVAIGLADHFLYAKQKEIFVEQLLSLNLVNKKNIDLLCHELQQSKMQQITLDADGMPIEGKLTSFVDKLSPLQDIKSANDAVEFIAKLVIEDPDNKMLNSAHKSLINGSPISVHLVMQQLQRSLHMSLADCFRMELSMAYQCGVMGEFEEGVRALLIDKDKQANWHYPTIGSVPLQIVDAHFTLFLNAPKQHPLADLEQVYGEYHAN